MNYFSHFAVDHIPGNHEYNTGLLLPDITKRWVKTFRHPQQEAGLSRVHINLLHGCLKHYESDKRFHASDFFGRNFRVLNERIKQAAFTPDLQRKWFLGHIMFELLLDRVIVREYRSLLDSFYESLDKVDEDGLHRFLRFYGMNDTEGFFSFFNHFRSVKYIYFYTDNKKFLYSLNRIMLRVGLKEMNETNMELLEGILVGYESDYFADPAVVLRDMKKVFDEQNEEDKPQIR